MEIESDLNLEILEAFSSLRREMGLIFAGELKSMGLGYNQMLITYFLSRSPLRMCELSDLSYSDPASTTRTVSSLEKSGFVKREPDKKDSRCFVVELTPKGKARANEILKTRKKLGKMIGVELSSKEKKILIHLLKKVRTQLAGRNKEESL